MAVTFVTVSTGVPSDTIDMSSASVGDLMVARLLDDVDDTAFSVPSGWTSISSYVASGQIGYHSCWRRATSTDISGGLTFPYTGTTSFGVIMVQVYRGALSSGTPIALQTGVPRAWAYPSTYTNTVGPLSGVAGGASSVFLGFGYPFPATPSFNPPLASQSRSGNGQMWGIEGTELLTSAGSTATYDWSIGAGLGFRGSNSLSNYVVDAQIILPEVATGEGWFAAEPVAGPFEGWS